MDVQQLKGGRVNVGSWFEGAQSITVGKAGRQKREVARPTVSAVRSREGEMLVLSLLSPVYSLKSLAMGRCHIQSVFLPHLTQSRRFLSGTHGDLFP